MPFNLEIVYSTLPFILIFVSSISYFIPEKYRLKYFIIVINIIAVILGTLNWWFAQIQ
jgi:hypothetical protein